MLNRTAKQWLKTGGVVDLSNELRQRKSMVIMPVEEVLADDYPNHLELLELIRYYSNLASTQLEIPTNDTRDIVKRVLPCLDKIWQTDNRYEKAGIVKGWQMKRNMLSPAYTTRFSELPMAFAK